MTTAKAASDTKSSSETRAAIDIGTNTVLLLVADVVDGKLNTRLELQEIPRLGRHVDSERLLADEGMQKVVRVLSRYSSIIRKTFGKIPVIVTATSAVRDAANRDDFLSMVKSKTGFDVRLLSGSEEADCTFTGAVSPLEFPSNRSVMVVDIGGGSTELAAGMDGQLTDGLSIDMGSVRFSERFLKNDPPGDMEILNCRRAIHQLMSEQVREEMHGMDYLVAVAGTATTIAALIAGDQGTTGSGHTINNMNISRSELRELSGRLLQLSSGQILNLDQKLLAGRADIIQAGILILEGVMDYFGFETLIVSNGGIRHGALLKDWLI
jgi:exopolyphosphatase / guanosine-5'-triphosphate,3'-diphosphate pyrophosphatase